MPYVIAAIVLVVAGALGWLARPLAPDEKRRAALAEAVSAVDRELAGDLELMSMFDQTKQAVVLENAAFERTRATLEEEAATVFASLAAVYARIPDAESAMERRGPANSIRDDDRATIEAWEGDARAAQHALRATLDAPRPFGWRAAMARLRGSPPSR